MLRLRPATGLVAALLFAPLPGFAETVSLERAVELASINAPRLLASEAAVSAASAARLQAEARPTPSLTMTAENFAGSGRYDVWTQSEITASYAQTLERGRKREARIALAERDIGVAAATAQVIRLNLAAQVERAYYDVVIADEVATTAKQRLKTESELQEEALRRVRGYKDPLFVETQAAARVAEAKVLLEAAQRSQINARQVLASFWGGSGDGLEVSGDVLIDKDAPTTIAPADEAFEEARIARAAAAVELEQSRRVQDYTLSSGLRYLKETDDVAVVFGITVPIGRFNQNHGNIKRAEAERLQLELEAQSDRLERLRRLAVLKSDADSALMRAQAIKTEILPKATQALEQVREGYRRGGFTFSDMQGAADAVIEAQQAWIAEAHRLSDLQTEIDRLSGRFEAFGSGEPAGSREPAGSKEPAL
ncbi:MAG: TolC family protein [Pseudomonadales bacterium]